jgi:tyrosinase
MNLALLEVAMRSRLAPFLLAAIFSVSFQNAGHSQVAANIEFEVNLTSDVNDDFLCWSPSPVKVRLLNGEDLGAATLKLTVRQEPVSADSTGAVAFQSFDGAPVSRGNYAPKDSIELQIPANGDWVQFWVEGKEASTDGKDVSISFFDDQQRKIAFITTMVRVRKDARTLSSAQRTKFLNAVKALHDAGGFEKYHMAHAQAFLYEIHGSFSANKNPLFLAWHRAFLLNFERDLQQFDQEVSLPYWKFDEVSFLATQSELDTIFSPTFLGGANPQGNPVVEFAELSTGVPHPWFNWRTNVSNQPLERNNFPDDVDPFTGSKSGPISAETLVNKVLNQTSHDSAAGQSELNYHNGAHSRVMGWLGQVYSPADPLFFLLHANVDRAWAHWQAKQNAFDDSGNDTKSYHAIGKYPGNAAQYRDGSYALDTMWPWRPDINDWPQGFYFRMPVGVNGPDKSNPPTPASQIDYLNLAGDGVASGACYDDMSYAVSAGLQE